MKRLFTIAALAALPLGVAVPAQAGLLINPDGIAITGPETSLSVRVDADGVTRWGSPAQGYRRFGRNGYFASPYDVTLPFNGRNAFGGAGRAFDDALRAKSSARDRSTIFSLSFWGL